MGEEKHIHVLSFVSIALDLRHAFLKHFLFDVR